MSWRNDVRDLLDSEEKDDQVIESIRGELGGESKFRDMPVDNVIWVPLDQVRANDYNPNTTATHEMKLLKKSIDADGLTQPVVVIRESPKSYVIVDGFHRYQVVRTDDEIKSRTKGLIPVVVLNKTMNERRAATVRHNRARGAHTITGMSNLVMEMLDDGAKDEDVCMELGMEPEELVRLKHLTGYSKLYEDAHFSKEWKSRKMIEHKLNWEKKNGPTSHNV